MEDWVRNESSWNETEYAMSLGLHLAADALRAVLDDYDNTLDIDLDN